MVLTELSLHLRPLRKVRRAGFKRLLELVSGLRVPTKHEQHRGTAAALDVAGVASQPSRRRKVKQDVVELLEMLVALALGAVEIGEHAALHLQLLALLDRQAVQADSVLPLVLRARVGGAENEPVEHSHRFRLGLGLGLGLRLGLRLRLRLWFWFRL